MRDHITRNVSMCSVCQKQKKQCKKYGLLPEKEAEYKPWEWLCVNLIGPYKIRTKKSGHKIPELRCVMIINPVTGWFEIKHIVEQEWLARYPRPYLITLDQGSEFISQDFHDVHK